MSDLCHKQGCDKLGDKKCSACREVSYCSVECQKGDWKAHKRSCITMNKFYPNFVGMPVINKLMQKVEGEVNILQSEGKYKAGVKLMQKLLAFIENQFGEPVFGTPLCMRSDGIENDTWILIIIRNLMINLLRLDGEIETIFVYAIEARQLLEGRDKSFDKNLLMLSDIELHIASIYVIRNDFPKAEYHCEQCLMYARLIKGEGQIQKEYRALMNFSDLRGLQCRFPEVIELSSKAYINVTKAYGPVHPDVQAAAATLIEHLIKKGDYDVADNYCRMNYENLIDPSNGFKRESEEVAEAMRQIVDIWMSKTPPEDEKAALALADEAEDMIRKACKTISNLFGRDSFAMILYYDSLSKVLLKRGKYTAETRSILVRSLELHHQHKVKFGVSTHNAELLVASFDAHVQGLKNKK